MRGERGEPLDAMLTIRFNDTNTYYGWTCVASRMSGKGNVVQQLGRTPGHAVDLALIGLGIVDVNGNVIPEKTDGTV